MLSFSLEDYVPILKLSISGLMLFVSFKIQDKICNRISVRWGQYVRIPFAILRLALGKVLTMVFSLVATR